MNNSQSTELSTKPKNNGKAHLSKELKAAANSEEVIVRYRPYAETTKWFKYRFSAWNSSKAWISGLMLIMFCASLYTLMFGGNLRDQAIGFILYAIASVFGKAGEATVSGGLIGNSAAELVLVQAIQWTLALIALTATVTIARHPTHISINKLGLSREWRLLGGITLQQNLDWADIDAIELVQPAGTTSPHDCMIKFRKKSAPGGKLVDYPINLKVGAIASMEEREQLMKAIERFGGEIRRDAKLLELMAPPQNTSYTELWLQALSAPPKRERLTPLTSGSLLQDGAYEIIDQLGVGGQGTAYLAKRLNDHHELVLKEFILPVYVDVNVRRQALERMQNEASMLSRLDDPRIVRLLDFFVEDHRGYLVLEKIDGNSLRVAINQKGAFQEKTVFELARQMCEMLAYLQSLSPPVVHRDFTPDNLILGKDGVLKLVDFNVAQQTESTATGTVVGKHAYIAPEQFRGKPLPASDIYSMGATLVFLITGQDPEPITCTRLHKDNVPVSDKLDMIVSKATALDVAKRYSNPSQIMEDLDKFDIH